MGNAKLMGRVRSITTTHASVRVRVQPKASITYDGAEPEQLSIAIPLLRKHGLRATFFVTAENVLLNPRAWQEAAQEGHEIACHPFLDCSLDGELPNWKLHAVREELVSIKRFVAEVLGQFALGFAYPGITPNCYEGSYEPVVRELFSYARSAVGGVNKSNCDPYAIRTIRPQTWDDDAMAHIMGLHPSSPRSDWAVLTFHDLLRQEEIHARAIEFCGRWKSNANILPISAILRNG